MDKQEEATTNEYIRNRLLKAEKLRERGIEPYPYAFDQKDHAAAITEAYQKLKEGEETKKVVSVAGRIMTFRPMGKAGFAHLMDQTGKIQIYAAQDLVSEKDFFAFNKTDLGDIVGIKGTVFKTKKGEITVKAHSYTMLCKCIRPLPEKWHGLKDVEIRYRKRYLDLVANPQVKDVFIKRFEMIRAMREFLEKQGFIEIETPILQSLYGGASARPFKSFLHDLKMDVYLRISDELYLKRLIVGGFEKVYEIGRVFRNESIDRTHNPEFTMMECYWAYADYHDMMNMTEQMWEHIAKKVFGRTTFTYQGKTFDLKTPWKRMTMKEALKIHANIDVDKLHDHDIQDLLTTHNIDYEGDFTRGLGIQLLFEELVEDKLVGPVFILDHPRESTPLCKKKRGDDALIERLEPYLCGMEVGNAYSELNDPLVQKKLLEEQARQLRAGNEEAHPYDADFIEALEVGMPPTAGLGVGIDRMAMLLTDSPSIRDVLAFPFMKPEEE